MDAAFLAPPATAGPPVLEAPRCATATVSPLQPPAPAGTPLAPLAAGLAVGLAASRRSKRPQARPAATAVAAAPSVDALPSSLETLEAVRGVLPNGLRYVVLPHAVPAGRFEAHLEFHVGSVDENDQQRGMAHMLEHVCFLGSQRRRELQAAGVGLTSNALTDFQHTVYHLSLGSDRLDEGLGMLLEVGFAPVFEPERIEKERSAVLSEAQMVNDVQYRLHLQMISAIHSENKIHTRFPIGLESQIAKWTREELQTFYGQWYKPENATLYIVGDVEPSAAVAAVEKTFAGVAGAGGAADPWHMDVTSMYRPAMPARPRVLHDFVGPERALPEARSWTADLEVSVAVNELLQGMQVMWAAKRPMSPERSPAELLPWFLNRLVVEVVKLRLQTRWCASAVPCDFHHYDSPREAACLTTLVVKTEPNRWEETCGEVLQEVRAVGLYGATESELDLCRRMLLSRVAEAARAQPWSVMGPLKGYEAAATSRDVADALIAATPGGHMLTRAGDFSAALESTAAGVALGDLNAAARSLLEPFGGQGAISGTVVVSCPASTQDPISGAPVPYEQPSSAAVRTALLGVEDLAEEEVRSRQVTVPATLLPNLPAAAPVAREVQPDGAVALLLPNGLNVSIRVQKASPDGQTQSSMRLTAPGGRAADALTGQFGALPAGLLTLQKSGVGEWSREECALHQRLNSVEIELRPENHVSEVDVHFASSPSSVRAGLEWLHWMLREPNMNMKSFSEAQVQMKGIASACEKTILARSKQLLLEQMYPRDRWLWEATTLDQVNLLTLGQARKAVMRQIGGIANLRLDIAAVAGASGSASGVNSMSHEDAGSVSDGQDAAVQACLESIEREVCSIMGALPPAEEAVPELPEPRMAARGCELRDHLLDGDERALVVVGGGAPNVDGVGDATWRQETLETGFSWGATADHPLKVELAMLVMNACMNGRLIGYVRDQLSLTYSCALQLTMFKDSPGGYFVCRAFAAPAQVAKAAQAVVQILRSPNFSPFLEREVEANRNFLAEKLVKDKSERGHFLSRMGRDSEEAARVLQQVTSEDVTRAWQSLTGLDDPFVLLQTSGAGYVASSVPQGDIVQRRRAPTPAAAPAAGAGLAMLD